MSGVKVHWLRHGQVASHRGDVPITDEGIAQSRERGRILAEDLSPGEIVHFMHAPTLRTRQTIEEVRTTMTEALGPDRDVDLLEVREQQAIRNPDLFVAGQRVEMVSSVEALADQLSEPPVASATLSENPFFKEFWASPDRIGYWVKHPDPPGENAAAVARRQLTFATSLRELVEDRPMRYVLSTHSPVLRAILTCYLETEPGEPEYLESIDFILSKGKPAELRFRDSQKVLQNTKLDVGASRRANLTVP